MSPLSHVPPCAGRCLTWSWVRSSTSLRTRRRVDRLPRSCPTSSSTAKLSNSLVRLSFFLLVIFSHISGCCKLFCRSQGEEFSLALYRRSFRLTSYHPPPCHPPSNLLDTEEVTHRKPSSSISLWTLDILVFRSVPLPHRTPTETVVIHSLPNPPMGKIGLLGCVVSPWASATTTTTQGKF